MAEEKPKDDKPKGDAKPKTDEKPAEQIGAGREILRLLFMFFIISTLLGGVASSVSGFLSGNFLKSISIEKLMNSYSRPFASVINPIGGFATVTSDKTDVYDTPGGRKIGTQKKQASGRVVKGAVEIDGVNYWYIDFDKDPDGWVSEDDLGYRDPVTRPLGQTEKKGTVVKTNSSSVSVYDTPGGSLVDTRLGKDYGKIAGGPETRDGVVYWYVDFDEGVDGWVKASDLVVVEPKQPSGATRLFLRLYELGSWLRLILWIMAFILVCVLTYVIWHLSKIRENAHIKLYGDREQAQSVPVSINKDWDRVMMHVESYNESEWRLAVIEADIMLSELLNTMDLQGDSIGEKLKGVEKSDFTTLDLAWEAHKVRNQIAHDPAFVLTQREAKRVVGLFEAVFKEFSFI